MDGSDLYDLEDQAVLGSMPNNIGEGQMVRPHQGERLGTGTLSDVYLDESGVRGRQRGSSLFTENPGYSQEAEKKQHRLICTSLIFVFFLALVAGIAANKGMGDKSISANTEIVPDVNGAFNADEGEDVADAEEEKDASETPTTHIETGDEAEIALQEEISAIEKEREVVIYEEDMVDTEEQKELYEQEAAALGELEDAAKEEEALMEEMDNASTDEEIDLLNEEADVLELIEDNLGEQADLLDQAVNDGDPKEVQDLEEEVEQLQLQEDNLENQLDAEIAQEENLPPPQEDEGED